MSLTALTRVRSLLGISAGVTFHDQALTLAVEMANDYVLGILEQTALTTSASTEYPNVYDDGQVDVYLDRSPIVSMVAVTNAGVGLVEGSDYRFNSETGMMRMIRGTVGTRGAWASWSAVLDDVQVTYIHGYTAATVPRRLKRAADLIAVHTFRTGKHAGAKSEKHSSVGIVLSEDEIPPTAALILSEFDEVQHF